MEISLTRVELVKLIGKKKGLTLKDAKRILENLIEDGVHIRTRTIGSDQFTEKSHVNILFEIKEKYRAHISRYLGKLEEIQKEKSNLQKQEDDINKKLEEILGLFDLGFDRKKYMLK